MRPNARSLLAGVAVAAAGALTLAACGDSGPETGKINGVAGGKPTADARTIEVTASNFDFDPDRITIDAQEEIALELRSADGPHDLAVDGLGMVADVTGGETRVARLRIDEPGSYTFFCTLPGHRDGGMEGTLVVR